MDSESGTIRQGYLSPLCSDLPGLIGKEEGVGGREGSLGGPAQRAFVTLIEYAGRSGVGGMEPFCLTSGLPCDSRDTVEQGQEGN